MFTQSQSCRRDSARIRSISSAWILQLATRSASPVNTCRPTRCTRRWTARPVVEVGGEEGLECSSHFKRRTALVAHPDSWADDSCEHSHHAQQRNFHAGAGARDHAPSVHAYSLTPCFFLRPRVCCRACTCQSPSARSRFNASACDL